MDSPADNKRTAALALAILGLLMVGALVVLTVFDGDDESPEAADPSVTSAPTGGNTGGSGSSDGKPPGGGASGGVDPILTEGDAVAAHQRMTEYMVGLNTYTYTDKNASWAQPLLALTTGDAQLKQDTALPTGKVWATCVATQCASRGTATVVRDAMVADDLVRGSGKTVSSLVEAKATRSENGKETVTETNSWLVTVRDSGGGSWQVSSVSLFGLGNVGASDQAGE
ncbi:hypothetical protein ACFQ69_19790 [Streptomyces sp. NPDC056470]|uniref:hypothetical protein n=1 Tax=unclassified Streptomyces TaxID=2593676 RepID=UPI0036BDA334